MKDTLGRENRRLPDRQCANCGTAFRPRRVEQQHCSLKCGTARNGGKTRAAWRTYSQTEPPARAQLTSNNDPFIEIQLSQGQVALIAPSDFELICDHRWTANKIDSNWYAFTWFQSRSIGMHRAIMDAPAAMLVDHINHNTLDNRRSNLRIATPSQNGANRLLSPKNTSGFMGVAWDKERRCWIAQIKVGTVHRAIGRFGDPVQAALAYDRVAVELRGGFARTNFSRPGGASVAVEDETADCDCALTEAEWDGVREKLLERGSEPDEDDYL